MPTPTLSTIIRRRAPACRNGPGGGVLPVLAVVMRRRAAAAAPVVWPTLLAAVQAKWLSNLSLTAISPHLYLNEGPANPSYPFATVTNPDDTPSMNTGVGYFERKILRFAIYSTDDFALATYGESLKSSFDSLNRTKALIFANGYLMGFRRADGRLDRMPNQVKGKYIWRQSYNYIVTVGKTQVLS